jgi:putative transposase
MRTQTYPVDVTNAQQVLIEPRLPVHSGGSPRMTNRRDAVDAVFYILRTVWRYFDEWRHDSTLDTIRGRLRRKAHTAEKSYHPSTFASVEPVGRHDLRR